jgi:hypothetical protein
MYYITNNSPRGSGGFCFKEHSSAVNFEEAINDWVIRSSIARLLDLVDFTNMETRDHPREPLLLQVRIIFIWS